MLSETVEMWKLEIYLRLMSVLLGGIPTKNNLHEGTRDDLVVLRLSVEEIR